MRVALGFSLLLLAGCATERLALVPSPRVDLSGRWKLNEADSDDPQRVALSQSAGPAGGAPGATGGQGGRGGRGGSRGGAGAAGGYGGGPAGPAMPGVNALSDGLRWPGKELEIKQDAGIVTIASMGIRESYRPSAADKSSPPARPKGDEPGDRGRDPRRDRRDGPPPACGWDGSTLVVQAENPDDDHPPFEERYSLSEDGSRLIEVVAFKGGRSGGFTVSRVWERVAADAPQGR
jgi:hypothetical protein